MPRLAKSLAALAIVNGPATVFCTDTLPVKARPTISYNCLIWKPVSRNAPGIAASGPMRRTASVVGAPAWALVMPMAQMDLPLPASSRTGVNSSARRVPSRSISTMPGPPRVANAATAGAMSSKPAIGVASTAVIRSPSASTPQAGEPSRMLPTTAGISWCLATSPVASIARNSSTCAGNRSRASVRVASPPPARCTRTPTGWRSSTATVSAIPASLQVGVSRSPTATMRSPARKPASAAMPAALPTTGA